CYGGDDGSALNTQISHIGGIAFDASGNNMYITDCSNNRVRRIHGGIITTFAGNGASGHFNSFHVAATATPLNFSANIPNQPGIAVAANGNVYFSTPGDHLIVKVDIGTGIADVYTLVNSTPSGIAMDAFGNLFIADPGA